MQFGLSSKRDMTGGTSADATPPSAAAAAMSEDDGSSGGGPNAAQDPQQPQRQQQYHGHGHGNSKRTFSKTNRSSIYEAVSAVAAVEARAAAAMQQQAHAGQQQQQQQPPPSYLRPNINSSHSASASSASSRRISGNPSAHKRPYGKAPRQLRGSQVSSPARSGGSISSPGLGPAASGPAISGPTTSAAANGNASAATTTAAAAAAAVSPSDGSSPDHTDHGNSKQERADSLVNWAEVPGVTMMDDDDDEDDAMRHNSLASGSFGAFATSSSRTFSGLSEISAAGGGGSFNAGSSNNKGSEHDDGGTGTAAMDMRQAAMAATEYLRNLPEHERGSFVLGPGGRNSVLGSMAAFGNRSDSDIREIIDEEGEEEKGEEGDDVGALPMRNLSFYKSQEGESEHTIKTGHHASDKNKNKNSGNNDDDADAANNDDDADNDDNTNEQERYQVLNPNAGPFDDSTEFRESATMMQEMLGDLILEANEEATEEQRRRRHLQQRQQEQAAKIRQDLLKMQAEQRRDKAAPMGNEPMTAERLKNLILEASTSGEEIKEAPMTAERLKNLVLEASSEETKEAVANPKHGKGVGTDKMEDSKGDTDMVCSPSAPPAVLSREVTDTHSNARSNKSVSSESSRTLGAAQMRTGRIDDGDTYELPLTLAPPPLPSPMAGLVGLPTVIQIPSPSSLGSAGSGGGASRSTGNDNDGNIPARELQNGINRVVSHTLASTRTYLGQHFPSAGLGVRDLLPSPATDNWTMKPRVGLKRAAKGYLNALGEDPEIPPHLQAGGYKYGYERRCDVMLSPGSAATDVWYENATAMATFSLRYCSKHPVAIGPTDDDAKFVDSLLLYAFVSEHRTHVPHYTKFGAAVKEEIKGATQMSNEDDKTATVAANDEAAAAPATATSSTRRGNRPEEENAQSLGALLAGAGASLFIAPLVDPRTEKEYQLTSLSGVTGNSFTYGGCVDEPAPPTSVGGAVGTSRRCSSVQVKRVESAGLGADDGGDLETFYGLGRGITRVALVLVDSEPDPIANRFRRKSATGADGAKDPHVRLMEQFRLLKSPAQTLYPADDLYVGHGSPSKHLLLLDPAEAGRIYVNGQFVTIWGEDKTLATNNQSLFGFDLVDVPVARRGSKLVITDYEVLKKSVGTLIQEVLIDASQGHKEVGSKLLARLITGHDDNENAKTPSAHDINQSCLESEVMSSSLYDPVGISAKALATRFAMTYGREGFPCLPCDVPYVTERIGPHRKAVAVPPRVLDVLRRGGLFDLNRTEEDLWFHNPEAHYGVDDLGVSSRDILNEALRMVTEAMVGGNRSSKGKESESLSDNIAIIMVKRQALVVGGADEAWSHSFMCRRNAKNGKFYMNDAVFSMPLPDSPDPTNGNDGGRRARLLGLYISQRHPDPSVLSRFVLKGSA